MKIPPLSEKDLQQSEKILTPIYEFIKNYHSHTVVGIEKIQKNKNYLFIGNHSLATYDFLLLVGDIYYEKKIMIRSVVDNLVFATPILKKLLNLCHFIPGNFRALREVLTQGDSILIAPGGMKESLRSSEEKNTLLWENRKGFISLSILTGTPIVLAACPQADDLYDVKKSFLTEFVYEKFRFPLPFAKGRSALFPFLPKKIKLTHYIDGPFEPPKYVSEEDLDIKIDEFHAFICDKMKILLSNK